MAVPVASNDQKVIFNPHNNCLDLRNAMEPFWYHCYHMVPTPVPMLHLIWLFQLNKCSGTIDKAMGSVLILMLLASYDQNMLHLDLANRVVPWMTLLASCDTDTGINDITGSGKVIHQLFQLYWPNQYNVAIDNVIETTWCRYQFQVSKGLKTEVTSHFDHLELWNAIVLMMIPSVSCEANTGIKWPMKSRCTLFQSSWSSKQNCAIDSAINVMWYSHWCHQHHLSKRFMPHLVSISFT